MSFVLKTFILPLHVKQRGWDILMPSNQKVNTEQGDSFDKFKELARKLVAVPKNEIDEQAIKHKRRSTKKHRTPTKRKK